MKKTKKILLTGTHLTPALALIEQLKKDKKYSWKIYYIGRNFNSSVTQTPSIESLQIPNLNIPFYGINCGKLDRRWIFNTLKGLPQTISAYFKARTIIKKIKPHITVSFGGYVSVPVILASSSLSIPSITHEQTPTLSLSTKINSYFSDFTALSFAKDSYTQKEILTGNLLRPQIYHSKSKLFESLNIKKPFIYITAGNQGSHSINTLIPKLAQKYPKLSFIHQTGAQEITDYQKYQSKLKNYHPFDYINTQDIGYVLNNAQIIISRSGANTCQEIVALSKNSILIPLPKSQQNEQEKNALWVKEKLPQTQIIKQSKLTLKSLSSNFEKLLKQKPETEKNNLKNNPKLLRLIHETI